MPYRVLLVIACVFAPFTSVPAQQKIDRRLQLDATGMFKFFLSSGAVRVIGWDTDSIAVTGTISTKSQFYLGGGRQGAKGGVEGDGVEAMADLIVRVPRRARLWVRGGEADVRVEGMSGPLDCASASGSVRIEGTSDEVVAETMGGDLVLVGSPNYLRLKTATGRVDWSGSGEDGAITTVSGRVTVHGGMTRRGRIETVTGDVRYDGGIAAGSVLAIDTHAGNVDLRVPKGTNAALVVTAAISDLFGLRSMGDPAKSPSGIVQELGGATSGATLTIRTFKGRVTATSP
jgi:hypothetical protein